MTDSPAEKPNWLVWRAMSRVRVWQGVALSLDIEPSSISRTSLMSSQNIDSWASFGGFQGCIYVPIDGGALLLDCVIARDFNSRVEAAMAEFNGLKADSYVSLPTLAAWTVAVGWPVPAEFAALAQSAERVRPRKESWCISGEAVAHTLAEVWADVNEFPREGDEALAYEVQLQRAIKEGIKAGAIRRLIYPLMGPAPDDAPFEDCFFDWAELRAWAAKYLHEEWPVVPPWEKSRDKSVSDETNLVDFVSISEILQTATSGLVDVHSEAWQKGRANRHLRNAVEAFTKRHLSSLLKDLMNAHDIRPINGEPVDGPFIADDAPWGISPNDAERLQELLRHMECASRYPPRQAMTQQTR